jgi:hypothetical protein
MLQAFAARLSCSALAMSRCRNGASDLELPAANMTATNASVAVRARIFSAIDGRQGGDVTVRSM